MKTDEFYTGWTLKMLNALGTGGEGATCADVMHRCAEYHYECNGMEEKLNKYINDLSGFLAFLTKEWNWIITYDRKAGKIIADENKPECICPIVHHAGKMNVHDGICHCSEGFAALMFSKVTGRQVKVKVIRSILRGDASCVYEVSL